MNANRRMGRPKHRTLDDAPGRMRRETVSVASGSALARRESTSSSLFTGLRRRPFLGGRRLRRFRVWGGARLGLLGPATGTLSLPKCYPPIGSTLARSAEALACSRWRPPYPRPPPPPWLGLICRCAPRPWFALRARRPSETCARALSILAFVLGSAGTDATGQVVPTAGRVGTACEPGERDLGFICQRSVGRRQCRPPRAGWRQITGSAQG